MELFVELWYVKTAFKIASISLTELLKYNVNGMMVLEMKCCARVALKAYFSFLHFIHIPHH